MLRRSTLVFLGIFLILGIGLFLWQRYSAKQETAEPTATVKPTRMLFELRDQFIAGFTILNRGNEALSFEHSDTDGTWLVTGYPAESADSMQIDSVARNLLYMTVDTILPTEPPLGAMGLDKPAYTIQMMLDDGNQMVLSVGNLTPTGSGYYVKVDDNPAVVVAKAELEAVTIIFENPPLIPTPTSESVSTNTPEVGVSPETSSTPLP